MAVNGTGGAPDANLARGEAPLRRGLRKHIAEGNPVSGHLGWTCPPGLGKPHTLPLW